MKRLKYGKSLLFIAVISVLTTLVFPLPESGVSYSKALYSKEGILLSAKVSEDGQWCFPYEGNLPDKLTKSIILYEDEYFRWHPGINPVSAVKAFVQNRKRGKIVRGASTLPMQVMRMRNKNASRSWLNKIREMAGAIKYSLIHTDEYILREWCNIAPFGGNTVGVGAASLRYFGRPVTQLSWSECALLAVMPNGPSSANLRKNREVLKQKRDLLLHKLAKKGYFNTSELTLYLGEEIPVETRAIPSQAYHALEYLASKHPERYVFQTTIPATIQETTLGILQQEASFLKSDGIGNLAAVIIDLENDELTAYHGNIRDTETPFSYVDVAQAPRSYGSLLKPLLYAHCLETGTFLPNELVADIPTAIGEFQPENFDKKYRGAVPLEEIVIKSLNVPAVRTLNTCGLQTFYEQLERLDIQYLDKGAGHYGLSIILGGGESSLWDLSRIYKGLALNYSGHPDPFRPVRCLKEEKGKPTKDPVVFSAYAMDYTVRIMADLTRPREEKSWDLFSGNKKTAWKTGTSYGHKDAWAIGFTGRYMVAVWVGNEDGEGRFDLTGISKAAPVMFKLFNVLPDNHWFNRSPAYSHKEKVTVCGESGKLAGPLCKHTTPLVLERSSLQFQQCSYHQTLLLDGQGQSLSEQCAVKAVSRDTLFSLPSYMEYYYKPGHPEYAVQPPSNPDCRPEGKTCRIMYPQEGLKIFLPRESSDKQNPLIAKAYNRDEKGSLFWFADEKFIKATKPPHDCLVNLEAGNHILSVTDQEGNRDEVTFEILKSDQSQK